MRKTLTVVAVDDEFRALEVIERYVDKVPFLNWKGSFTSPVESLSFLNTQHIDLIFLDINMPDLSGTALAKMLKPDQQVIFTTAYSEYAVEGFSLNATDYLLKPIEFDRFLEACLKAQGQTGVNKTTNVTPHGHPKQNVISIKSGTKIERIDTDDILFFEKQGNDMLIHVFNRELIRSRMNMKSIFELVSDVDFCQVHKSFVIALDKIGSIENHQVTIQTLKIPIGRSYQEGFKKRLNIK